MKKMSKTICSLFIVLTASLSFAQSSEPQANMPSSLGSTMKRMSSDLKKIATQVNDPKANAQSEALALDYVSMALHSKNFTPDTITSLPASQQKEQKAQYDLALDNTAENGTELAQAFHDNNNAKAVEILNLLSKDKKDGHARFK